MTNNDGYIWNGETLPSFDSANLCSLSGCKGYTSVSYNI